jgi:multiple sugar transport system ATP-binding protein
MTAVEPASVELQGVEKHFGATVAVSSLDLAVAPGEFLVLLGPSGCGKSTALRLIAGLEELTAGTIRIGGTVVNDVEPQDRDIAMVFQSYALYPHLSVRRNIEFPLRARRVPTEERNRLVADAAATLQLGELLGRKPAQLSGGQRQRVALARAIVRQPQAFLMDEPLSNLDARLRVEMRAELIDLHLRTGTTVIYVTHDQVEAMTMGDRIAVMRAGRLEQLDTPAGVHDRPASVFVAGFIGSPPMNLFTGDVVDGPAVVVPGGRVRLPFAVSTPKVIIGIRPEDLSIAGDTGAAAGAGSGAGSAGDPPGDDDGAASLVGTVALVESLGHEHHVACRVPGQADLVILRLRASARPPALGETLQLNVTGMVHVFDAGTERRIDA